MAYRVLELQGSWLPHWDPFVEQAHGGTIFHRLDFLAYHGDRFAKQESHVMFLDGDTLVGVMPMAVLDGEQGSWARSPYGGSYGGPVFKSHPTYHQSQGLVQALLDHLRERGVHRLVMTMPIAPAFRQPCDTFRFALLEAGFTCRRRDISSVVPLATGQTVEQSLTSRARNMVRKSRKESVEVVHRGDEKDFWRLMALTFAKHGAEPTHTQEQWDWLRQRFPQAIFMDLAYHHGEAVAGVGYMEINQRLHSSFYFCQDPEHQNLQGLSLLIQEGLSRCQAQGYAWFDFGTSSVDMQARPGIFLFKEGFGAVGAFRETYEWQD
ncbi:MAG: GNAT family N-acetyltransferase [Desulfarculus sp.]|nr:GNAT family N-acetyltransferase [Desulfarculus sp.]